MKLALSPSFQSTDGLSGRRTFYMTSTDPTATIVLEAGAAADATSGVRLTRPNGEEIRMFGSSCRVQVDDAATFLRYVVLGGSGVTVWCVADADPAVGPMGPSPAACWDKDAADSLAADTTSAVYFFRAARALTISAMNILPNGSLTGHNTNYATITASVEDGAGGAVGTAGSQTTKTTGGSGSWTAGTPVALTLGASVNLSAGQVLKVAIGKTAAGVVVPPFRLQVDFA